MEKKKKIVIYVLISVVTVCVGVFVIAVFGKKPVKPVREEIIREECPYDLSDAVDWTFYPSNNLAGLEAIAVDAGQPYTTAVYAFSYDSPLSGRVSGVIRKHEKIYGYCKDGPGYFEFDPKDVEVQPEEHSYYVKLTYDSRIRMNSVCFDRESEYLQVGYLYQEDEFALNYGDYRKYDTYYDTRQIYLPEEAKWDKWDRNTWKVPDDPGYCGPSLYWEWEAVDQTQVLTEGRSDDVTFTVTSYRFENERRNIYGEIEIPRDNRMKFTLASDEKEIKQEERVILYRKEGDVYVDVTPEDALVEQETNELDMEEGQKRYYLFGALISHSMDELAEGDYRLQYGDRILNFRLVLQQNEAW